MNYGLSLTMETSKKLLWDIQQAWSEIKRYLDTVNTWAREGGKFDVVQPATHRLRAGCTYCSAANSPFQGLGADIAKRAGWYVWCETMTPGTVLYGARTVNMVHDSIMLEAPLERVDECMKRQEELMCKAQAEFLPDVRPGVESKAMSFWQK
jgi:DNA polymerase I-like protein with 3'-5' exonuclease and polymerase domains